MVAVGEGDFQSSTVSTRLISGLVVTCLLPGPLSSDEGGLPTMQASAGAGAPPQSAHVATATGAVTVVND